MQTEKKVGRPRKVMDLPVNIEEGADAPAYIARDGQASGLGIGAQAEPSETPSGGAWDELVEFLSSTKSHKASVAMAYHPEPEQEWVSTPTGWVRVVEGEAGYTFNSGETVRLDTK